LSDVRCEACGQHEDPVNSIVDILAHRANVAGPDRANENSLKACETALIQGFGLEIDLRRTAEGFLISHDPSPLSERNDLTLFAALFAKHPLASVAVNVKELGYEPELIRLFEENTFGAGAFYFDFELLEPASPGAAQKKLRGLPGGSSTRVAARLSDRGETLAQALSIPGEIVWADEFDGLWLTRREVEAVHRAGRKIFVISPELHGFNAVDRRQRWADFKAWGVDGLCTDYALEACDFLNS
jgi:glycerophosphoryl diester phosphodiesterase